EVEQRGGVVGILEDVRRGLVDRDRARPRHGIGMLSRVETERFKSGRLRCGHLGLVEQAKAAACCATVGDGASAPSVHSFSQCARPEKAVVVSTTTKKFCKIADTGLSPDIPHRKGFRGFSCRMLQSRCLSGSLSRRP